MKHILESWRKFKLLVEEENEQTPDKELKKQVEPVDEDWYPIQKWADENGFTLRQINSDALKSALGQGAYGKAFAAVKNGKEYAVKIGSTGREEEMNVIDKLIALRSNLPENVARHIIKFYSPSELSFKDEVTDDKGQLYYVSVAELLEPLSKGDLKKLESTKWRNRFNNVEVDKNPFWSNEEWGDVENSLQNKLEQFTQIKTLFIDALYETRFKISKDEKLQMLRFQKDFSSRADAKNNDVMKALGKEPLNWEKIWTEMIMDKLPETKKGKILLNYCMKKLDMKAPDAIGYVWNMVSNSGKIIFFSDVPVDYHDDKDTSPDTLPPGELKDFDRAMKILRDEYGIVANDIHQGNIMRRGRDWVMMDIGLFEVL